MVEGGARLRVGVDVSVTAFNRAGTGRYARCLLRALQALDDPSVAIIPLSLPPAWQAASRGARRKGLTLFWEWLYGPFLLPALCRAYRCDVAHVTLPTPLRRLPCPTVATVHDAIPFLYPQWFAPIMGARLRRWLKRTLRHADHLIADSQSTARDVATVAAGTHPPITPVYLGGWADGLPDEGSSPPRGDEPPYILSVGTLEPRKNLSTVLEAYGLWVRAGESPPELRVVGAADWMADDVQARARALAIAGRVRLLGYVSDAELRRLYERAAMLVYPSLYEGFGIPPLEAMSCGCPVVTSNVSSLPEVVGDAGVLVEPLDARALADAMRSLLRDPAKAARLRQRGLAQAARFSWERCARETVAVYHAVKASA